MAKFSLVLVLIITCSCVQLSYPFILPLQNPDGSLNFKQLYGHIALLESSMTTLQQTLKSQEADIVALKTEVSNLKASQQKLNTRVFDLQKQSQITLVTAEVVDLKNQVKSLTSEFKNLTQDHRSLSSMINSSCADHNVTKTVYSVRDTLNRVLSHVHTAENDRFLLHGSVTKLSKTISELSDRSNASEIELAEKIAQLNSEVGFEIWKKSATVTSRAIVKFDDIHYNMGGGYNASTGMFTAPVSGTYLFWAQVMKYTGPDFHLYINQEGTEIGKFYTPTTGFVTGTVITSAHVRVGEEVHVTSIGAQNISWNFESRFGGTLLYRHVSEINL